MEKIAKIVSWLFLPMMMPIFALILAMYVPNIEHDGYNDDNLFLGLEPELKYRILVLFVIFTAVFPMMLIVYLKQNGVIKTYEMDDKQDRGFPIFVTSLFCYLLFGLLWYKTKGAQLPFYIYSLPLIGGTIISLVGFITRWYKISLHALGAGFFCGFLYVYFLFNLYYSQSLLWLAFIVAGIIMSARLYLQKHTLGQVVYGFSLGFIGMLLGLFLGMINF